MNVEDMNIKAALTAEEERARHELFENERGEVEYFAAKTIKEFIKQGCTVRQLMMLPEAIKDVETTTMIDFQLHQRMSD